MFYSAYSPGNIAPLAVISQGSPQEIKRTQGETLPGREMVALCTLEEALPARLRGYRPAGAARPTRAFLSAEPHGPHKAISFQPLWAHSSSFFQLRDINLNRATPAGRRSGLCYEATGPSC